MPNKHYPLQKTVEQRHADCFIWAPVPGPSAVNDKSS